MPYKYKEIEKRLFSLGFKVVRQNWSHVLFSNWKLTLPVPNHWWKDISPWVEKSIIKVVWLTKEEFKIIK